MGRCCLWYALSLHFECAFVLDGVGVSSSSQVFPHLSLGRQWSFLSRPHQRFFEFLVIFRARVTSSVYCSMIQAHLGIIVALDVMLGWRD